LRSATKVVHLEKEAGDPLIREKFGHRHTPASSRLIKIAVLKAFTAFAGVSPKGREHDMITGEKSIVLDDCWC
jgi:hypothetical protein